MLKWSRLSNMAKRTDTSGSHWEGSGSRSPPARADSLPRLPDFLFIGAMKSGSSSFRQYLTRHPQVFIPPGPKEPGFFAEEIGWGRGLDWYRSLFAGAGSAEAVGEGSNCYSGYPRFRGIPGRIAQVVPDVRLIYVVRDPIDRIRSHYIHNRAKGLERSPIERAVIENPDYLDRSRYAMQIEQYLEWFPLERMLILLSEDLRTRRQETMQRVFRFLGVATDWTHPVFESEFYRSEKRRYALTAGRMVRRFPGYGRVTSLLPTRARLLLRRLLMRPVDLTQAVISADLRRYVGEQLRPDVVRLRRYLGREFHCWGIA